MNILYYFWNKIAITVVFSIIIVDVAIWFIMLSTTGIVNNKMCNIIRSQWYQHPIYTFILQYTLYHIF
jgi:hypothetical protein